MPHQDKDCTSQPPVQTGVAVGLSSSQWAENQSDVGNFQEVSLEGWPFSLLSLLLLVGQQLGQLELEQSHWSTGQVLARCQRCRA